MILDSGKTLRSTYTDCPWFESVAILDSGKSKTSETNAKASFESVVILDRFSKKGAEPLAASASFFLHPKGSVD